MMLGYQKKDLFVYNVKIPLIIKLPKKTSNILIAGKSGSGKSLSTLYYIAQLIKNDESLVFIADYKAGEEYEMLEVNGAYASGEEAVALIQKYYEFFSLIRERRVRLNNHYSLVIEEYSGLLNWLEMKDKKLKNVIMAMVAEMLSVGRGLNIGVILCVQRADATYFSNGARDQFQCVICFGRCSAEQFRMLGFSGELEHNPTGNYQPGQALVLIDGQDAPKEIIVPRIKRQDILLANILNGLNAQPSLGELIRAVAEGESEEL